MEILHKIVSYPIREDDDQLTKQRKKLFFCFYLFAFVACGMTLVTVGTRAGEIGCIFFLVVSTIAMGHLLIKKEMTDRTVELIVYIALLTGLLFDYNTAASQMERFWPGFVILIDMTLVCRVSDRVNQFIVISVVLWLVLTSIEGATRFGLYDLGGTESASKQRERLTECDNPPCANVLISMQNLITYLFVFLMDYYFTRGFSKMVIEENRKMESAIETAQNVAGYLAAFDLERSKMSLESNTDLPCRLDAAFKNILSNLETYKEFLPQSCLPFDVEDTLSSSSRCSKTTASLTTPTTATTLATDNLESSAFSDILKRKNVTLTVSNIRNFLNFVGVTEVAAERVCAFVSIAIQAVKEGKGVIDHFLGDHVYASFNAVRACASHSDSALSSSLKIVTGMSHGAGSTSFINSPTTPAMQVNVGVVGGKAICGDMGCPGMKRFTIVGGVTNWANVVERLGASWGVSVLADCSVKTDSCTRYPLKLLEQTVIFKKRNKTPEPHRLWELVGDTFCNSGMHMEWMYEIDSNTHWEQYNQALDAWLSGQRDAALTLCSSSAELPKDAVVARIELEKRIRSGVAPKPPLDLDLW